MIKLIIKRYCIPVFIPENKNLFLWCVLFFILGIYYADSSSYFKLGTIHIKPTFFAILIYILAYTVILITVFYIKHIAKLQSNYHQFVLRILLLFVFWIAGLVTFIIHSVYLNNTVVLMKDLKNVQVTAYVSNIIKPSNKKYHILYLTNINLESINTSTSVSTIKAFTYYKYLKKYLHKTIKFKANLYSANNEITPYGINYKKYTFWKHIGASGFITGHIKVVHKIPESTFNSYSIMDKLKYNLNHARIKLKQILKSKINHNLSLNASGVATAVLLGGYSGISHKVLNNIKSAGLMPILAISGFHIAIIVGLMFFVIRYLVSLISFVNLNFNTKKLSSLITLILLIGYLWLIGGLPSALRAGIMFSFILISIMLGVKPISIRSLFLAVLLLLIVNPWYINYAGFILSVIATAAIITLFKSKYFYITKLSFLPTPKQSINKFGFKLLKFINVVILSSLVAQLSLFPLIVHYFHSFPILGVVSNLLVIPVFSFIIMPSLLVAILIPIHAVSYLFFKIAEQGIHLLLGVAKTISHLKYSVLYFPPSDIPYIKYYLLFFIVFIISKSYIKYIALVLACMMALIPFYSKYPSIILDQKLNVAGFLQSNNKYIFSNNKSHSFIKNMWVSNKFMIDKRAFQYSKNVSCDNFICKYKYNGFKVIVMLNKPIKTICYNADLIIKFFVSNKSCTQKTKVIDKAFVQKYGSSMIYLIKPNLIKIITNSKAFYVYKNS